MDTVKRKRRFTKETPSIQYVWDNPSSSWVRYYIFLDDDLLARLAAQACKNKSKKAVRGPVKIQLIKISES